MGLSGSELISLVIGTLAHFAQHSTTIATASYLASFCSLQYTPVSNIVPLQSPFSPGTLHSHFIQGTATTRQLTPTTAHANYRSRQLPLTPTIARANYRSRQPSLTPTTAHTTYHSRQLPLTPTTAHANYRSRHLPLTPTTDHANYRSRQLPLTPSIAHANYHSRQL
jgi:hypothetical protein